MIRSVRGYAGQNLANGDGRGHSDRQQAGAYLHRMAAAFQRATDTGELPKDADCNRLARRYQSDLTALKIEAHRSVGKDTLARSAEEIAQGIEALHMSGH